MLWEEKRRINRLSSQRNNNRLITVRKVSYPQPLKLLLKVKATWLRPMKVTYTIKFKFLLGAQVIHEEVKVEQVKPQPPTIAAANATN